MYVCGGLGGLYHGANLQCLFLLEVFFCHFFKYFLLFMFVLNN